MRSLLLSRMHLHTWRRNHATSLSSQRRTGLWCVKIQDNLQQTSWILKSRKTGHLLSCSSHGQWQPTSQPKPHLSAKACHGYQVTCRKKHRMYKKCKTSNHTLTQWQHKRSFKRIPQKSKNGQDGSMSTSLCLRHMRRTQNPFGSMWNRNGRIALEYEGR